MEGNAQLIQAAIIVGVPALIGALKVLTTSIPKRIIPAVVILMGAALQLCAAYVTQTELSPELAVVYGSASIGLREVLDQLRRLAGDLGAGAAKQP